MCNWSPRKRVESRQNNDGEKSFDKNYKCIDPGSSNNFKQNKHFLKKHVKSFNIKNVMKTSAKEKNLKKEKKDSLCPARKVK